MTCKAQPHTCTGHCLDEEFAYRDDDIDYFLVATDVPLSDTAHNPYTMACIAHIFYKYGDKVDSLHIDRAGIILFGLR